MPEILFVNDGKVRVAKVSFDKEEWQLKVDLVPSEKGTLSDVLVTVNTLKEMLEVIEEKENENGYMLVLSIEDAQDISILQRV